MTSDAFRRAIAVYPVLLRAAYAGQAETIAPDAARALLALLDVAESEIAPQATAPIHTLWDPVLTDEELDYVMPADEAGRAGVGAHVRRAPELQVQLGVSPTAPAFAGKRSSRTFSSAFAR